MFRVLILAVIYFVSVGAAKLCQNATLGTSRSLYYSGIADLIIHGYGYQTLAGISVISCGNLCLSDTRCFSINYSERDKLCELNGATASQYPPAMIEVGGSYYYRPEKPGFMNHQLFQTKIRDSHDSASAECQSDGKHLCQPWEIHQAYEAGFYRDIHVPIATSFWYSVPDNKVLVNATGLTYQEYNTPYPMFTNESYNLTDRDGQAEACSDLDAHLCTLAELKEAFITGYRQIDYIKEWLYFSEPGRDARMYRRGCGSYTGDECYDCIVANTPRPNLHVHFRVFCCRLQIVKSSPAMCCPGLVSPRDPIITQEVYATENHDGMESACSALEAHLCTLAELKEAYLQGYRQPLHQSDSCSELWLSFSEPNRKAKVFYDGCSYHTGVVDECYEGSVAHIQNPDTPCQVYCCPVINTTTLDNHHNNHYENNTRD